MRKSVARTSRNVQLANLKDSLIDFQVTLFNVHVATTKVKPGNSEGIRILSANPGTVGLAPLVRYTCPEYAK